MFVAFIVFTFDQYFFFVPFSNGVDVLSVLQALTMVGWVSLLAVPPLMFYRDDAIWNNQRFWLFVVAVTSWTVSTALIKLYNLINYGSLYADYLWVYPVFIMFEWIIPAIYIWLASDLREKVEVQPRPRRQRPVRVIEVIEDEYVETEKDDRPLS
jgi:hypothetical protein